MIAFRFPLWERALKISCLSFVCFLLFSSLSSLRKISEYKDFQLVKPSIWEDCFLSIIIKLLYICCPNSIKCQVFVSSLDPCVNTHWACRLLGHQWISFYCYVPPSDHISCSCVQSVYGEKAIHITHTAQFCTVHLTSAQLHVLSFPWFSSLIYSRCFYVVQINEALMWFQGLPTNMNYSPNSYQLCS